MIGMIDAEKPRPYMPTNFQTLAYYAEVGDYVKSHAWMAGLFAKVMGKSDQGLRLQCKHFPLGDEDNCVWFLLEKYKPEWRKWCLIPIEDAKSGKPALTKA